MKNVMVVDIGVSNIASVQAAINRLPAVPVLTQDPQKILAADFVMVPGVGTLDAGMKKLNDLQITAALRQRIYEGLPTFTICLGLQLLCAGSEESPGVAGLGIFNQIARRFPVDVRVPHFGWNKVRSTDPFFGEGYCYFANSFRLVEAPPVEWEVAWCDHGTSFVAAVRNKAVVATQFHPELSGEYGERIFLTWLEKSGC